MEIAAVVDSQESFRLCPTQKTEEKINEQQNYKQQPNSLWRSKSNSQPYRPQLTAADTTATRMVLNNTNRSVTRRVR
jgi:hypothetical protein